LETPVQLEVNQIVPPSTHESVDVTNARDVGSFVLARPSRWLNFKSRWWALNSRACTLTHDGQDVMKRSARQYLPWMRPLLRLCYFKTLQT